MICYRKDAGFLGPQRCNQRLTVEGRGRGQANMPGVQKLVAELGLGPQVSSGAG